MCAKVHFNTRKEIGIKLDNKHRYEYAPKLVVTSREIKVNII